MNFIKKHIVFFGGFSVFVVTFAIYLLILSFMEITFMGTANGAYKAVDFYRWMHGKGGIEIANALYYPMLKLVSTVFHLKTPFQIYQGIVLLNGFFSAALLAFLFCYFSVYLKSKKHALMVVFLHFILGGYFILSTNNEDIFPAYAFFVMGILLFNDFIRTNSFETLVYSVVLLSLSTLTHWTIGLPTFVGLVLFFLFAKKYTALERFNYLLWSGTITLIFFIIVSLALNIPLSSLIYPAKEINSLWVSSFELQKLILGLLNIPLFLTVGNTVRSLSGLNGISLIVFIIPLAISLLIGFQISRLKKQGGLSRLWGREKHFFWLLTIIAVVGFVMNIYEQGSDHQFLIQPCFIFFYVFAILLSPNMKNKVTRKAVWILFSFLLLSSIVKLFNVKHSDRQFFKQYEAVRAHKHDFKKTLFIGSPFRVFHIVAQLKLESPSDYHYLHLPSEDHDDFLLSAEDYETKYIQTIKEYEARGFQIVVIDLLDQSPEEAGQIYLGYDLSDKMERMKNYFLKNYTIETKFIFKENRTFYFIKYRTDTLKADAPATIYKF